MVEWEGGSLDWEICVITGEGGGVGEAKVGGLLHTWGKNEGLVLEEVKER